MATTEWFMAIGGQQVGPVTEADVVNAIKSGSADATTLVFVNGMANWTPLGEVDKFRPHLGAGAPPPLPRAGAAPSVPRAHEIDYKIEGEDLQFVEVELDPGESVVAEAGALMYMTAGIQMETIFGDGSGQNQAKGLMGALLGAGKRILTGESLFMTVFTAQGAKRERVAFAAPFPGRILAMDLKQLGGELICQKDSFLCAAKGISIGIAFQKKIGVGLFGGEGFIMQRLQGDGLCFVHAGGMLTADAARRRRDAARGHRLPGGTPALRELRRAVRGRRQDRLLRRRGPLLRDAHGPGPRLAAIAPAQPPGRPHLQGDPRNRPRPQGRRLGARRDRHRQRHRRRLSLRSSPSMETVLETHGLSFRYGNTAVVDGLDLEVARGDIFGFVGPNGAGKTTTIKLILGLLTPTAGEVRVLGLPLGERRLSALRRIGALVESPSLYGHLTAEENLRLQQLAFGVPAGRIAAVLDETALVEARGRLVRHFSLGMRQRLGIAMALLHEPELLVLDEPQNGLDPAGILELRSLLKQLTHSGRVTVFLSSHLLGELEQTITRLAVISHGRLRYQGTLAELREREAVVLRLVVGDPARALALLRDAGHVPALAGAGAISLAAPAASAARVNALLVGSGIDVHELRVEQPNLERIYMGLMQDAPAEAAGGGAP